MKHELFNKNGRSYIKCTESTWLKGFKTSEKVGFIEVQPDLAEANLQLIINGEIGAKFAAKRTDGIYEMEIVGLSD